MTRSASPARSPSVKSADRVLAILELFSIRQKPLTLTQIASELDYPMSSVMALLKSLCAQDYVRFDRDSKCYVPTLRVAMLGTWIMGNLYQNGAVIALMDQIQKDTGETVILGMRSGFYAQYLHTVQSRRLMRFYITPGLLRPLSDSAMGRALLMQCSESELRTIAARAVAGGRDKTAVDAERLIMDVRDSRQRGYAYSDQHTAGICAVALPLRISGEGQCAMAVAGPIFRLKRRRDKVAAIIQELSRAYLKSPAAVPDPRRPALND